MFSGETTIAGFSGILVLGLGDAFASVIGFVIGRRRWPAFLGKGAVRELRKTVEGTLAFIVAVVFGAFALGIAFPHVALTGFKQWFGMIMCAIITGMVTLIKPFNALCRHVRGVYSAERQSHTSAGDVCSCCDLCLVYVHIINGYASYFVWLSVLFCLEQLWKSIEGGLNGEFWESSGTFFFRRTQIPPRRPPMCDRSFFFFTVEPHQLSLILLFILCFSVDSTPLTI